MFGHFAWLLADALLNVEGSIVECLGDSRTPVEHLGGPVVGFGAHPAARIAGTSALGLIAYATPRGLSVVPGDGSATVTCPMSVQESDVCTTDYVRAGDYTATVSIVYDIRFEIGGTVVDTAEVPAAFRTITVDDDVPVAVREVQTRVTKVR